MEGLRRQHEVAGEEALCRQMTQQLDLNHCRQVSKLPILPEKGRPCKLDWPVTTTTAKKLQYTMLHHGRYESDK